MEVEGAEEEEEDEDNDVGGDLDRQDRKTVGWLD